MKQLRWLYGALFLLTLTVVMAACSNDDGVLDPSDKEQPVQHPDGGDYAIEGIAQLKIEASGIELTKPEIDGKVNPYYQIGTISPNGCNTTLTFPDLQNEKLQLPRIQWISLERFYPDEGEYGVINKIYPMLYEMEGEIRINSICLSVEREAESNRFKLTVTKNYEGTPLRIQIQFEYPGYQGRLILTQEADITVE